MAYQKVQKKKRYWETPDFVTTRTEAIRLHAELRYSTGEIAKAVGKHRTQIWMWLKAAGIYQPISRKQIAAKRKFSISSAHEAMRMKYKREVAAWKAIERHTRLHLCKECGIIFVPRKGIQGFCSKACRTKSYLKSNRELIAEKTKKKSKLLHRSRAEKQYAAKNPKCAFCNTPIPFSKFFKMSNVKYCSKKCSQKIRSEKRKNDPIISVSYKLTKKKTYQKRQLNGKNRQEKQRYYRDNIQARIAKIYVQDFTWQSKGRVVKNAIQP